MPYLLSVILTLALCFFGQAVALRSAGGRFPKSESNYFSSLGRIQAGAQGRVKVMVLGSSITGRLPDRAQGFADWANMGCDGGSAVDVLGAMDAGILPAAPLLVIEANTLHLAQSEKPTAIRQAMNGLWFQAGLNIPGLSAYARPSAFIYSRLLEHRIGRFENPEGEDLGVKLGPEMVAGQPGSALTTEESRLADKMQAILTRLKERGSRAVIVWLPPARSDGRHPPPLALEVARRCQIPYWDLGAEAAPGSIVLTDGVHMAAPSAAKTMRSMQLEFSDFR